VGQGTSIEVVLVCVVCGLATAIGRAMATCICTASDKGGNGVGSSASVDAVTGAGAMLAADVVGGDAAGVVGGGTAGVVDREDDIKGIMRLVVDDGGLTSISEAVRGLDLSSLPTSPDPPACACTCA
jgi:hypothetical protein